MCSIVSVATFVNKYFPYLGAHISKSERCYSAQSVWYYFYMKTNVQQDFYVCISVPLKHFLFKLLIATCQDDKVFK